MKKTEQNRKAWNEAILYHRKARDYDLIEKIENNEILDTVEKQTFENLDVKDKVICQLCCNNGRELISLVKFFGAKKAVGFDLSDEAIKEAIKLNEHFHLNIDFIRDDIANIKQKYFHCFDFVYITVGTLNWLNDVDEFFTLVNNLLKKDGKLIMYEAHPLAKIFAHFNSKEYNSDKRYDIVFDYFTLGEDKYDTGIDYIGKTSYQSEDVCEFYHTLSEIINSLVKSKLIIEQFDEFSKDNSATYEHIAEKYSVPLSYLLIASKRV